LFFVNRSLALNTQQYSFIFKGKIKSFFRLQRNEKTTLNQTRSSLNQFIETHARFFIFLLFCIGFFAGVGKLFPSPNQYLPDCQYSYLRWCEIKI
jgi:hypothetical protein